MCVNADVQRHKDIDIQVDIAAWVNRYRYIQTYQHTVFKYIITQTYL